LLQSAALSFKIEAHFLDIDLLNEKLRQHAVDFCKASFYAWFQEKENYELLPVGSALGFNCGPLLVSAQKDITKIRTIAVPGLQTTAYLLLRLYWKTPVKIIVLRFDQILPKIQQGEVDAGLIIHESRFLYPRYGLHKIKDLGEWWYEHTEGLPIPLGGIFYKKSLSKNIWTEFAESLQDSLHWARQHKTEALNFCREHAQEMEEEILLEHIQLYLNDFTLDLGTQGKKAIKTLETMAMEKHLL
jgi:1,4-dihydroxy-6-naphthoate synthase